MTSTDSTNNAIKKIECINPILNVKDLNRSREYYINVLGFREADWGRNMKFTFMGLNDAGIYFCENGQGQPGTWVWVGFDGDINLLYEELKAKGAIIKHGPANYSWAMELHITDPDGHVLRFGTEPNDDEPFLDRVD